MPRKTYTDDELKNLSLADAENEISNRVYESSYLFEQLEHSQKLSGNGHHLMQSLATEARRTLRQRWCDDAEVKAMNKTQPLD